MFRWISSFILPVLIFGGLLFLPAPTWRWGRAWIFLAVVFACNAATLLAVFRQNEGLLDERYKAPLQKGQPVADKVVLLALISSFIVLGALIPLDVFRFHLFPEPRAWASALGLALFVAGWLLIALAFRENSFAAPVVRHQKERFQTVIDTGVYARVRHPLYAGAVPVMFGMPLWFNSYAAALFAIVPIGILVLRIQIEEKFLRKELKGYESYTKRVRFRLIPWLW
ncbi:MAG: isoprenylcysteine carboxylmethyltransferase family protein [bacterium]